jgi:hypothetical protein
VHLYLIKSIKKFLLRAFLKFFLHFKNLLLALSGVLKSQLLILPTMTLSEELANELLVLSVLALFDKS